MNGGYIMIDCGGLNLTSQTEQTISGIYDRVTEAYATNKPVWANNCKWGTIHCSPIPVMVIQYTSTSFICTSSTLQIVVDSEDGVNIINLVGD